MPQAVAGGAITIARCRDRVSTLAMTIRDIIIFTGRCVKYTANETQPRNAAKLDCARTFRSGWQPSAQC